LKDGLLAINPKGNPEESTDPRRGLGGTLSIFCTRLPEFGNGQTFGVVIYPNHLETIFIRDFFFMYLLRCENVISYLPYSLLDFPREYIQDIHYIPAVDNTMVCHKVIQCSYDGIQYLGVLPGEAHSGEQGDLKRQVSTQELLDGFSHGSFPKTLPMLAELVDAVADFTGGFRGNVFEGNHPEMLPKGGFNHFEFSVKGINHRPSNIPPKNDFDGHMAFLIVWEAHPNPLIF